MTKKSFGTNQRRNLVIILVIAAVFVLIGVLVSQLRQSALVDRSDDVPAEGSIQIKGTMLCLPHKNTNGPQTLECAIGLKDSEGRHFALGDSDPQYGNITGVPMNQRVQVSGTFLPITDEKYPTIGTITVTKITEL